MIIDYTWSCLIASKYSGIKADIYTFWCGKDYMEEGVLIKYENSMAYVSIDEEPIILELHNTNLAKNEMREAIKYVGKHNDMFLKHFNGEFDDMDLLQYLRSREAYKDNEVDVLYDQVVEFVNSTGQSSISSIQRKFKIGCNRATNIIGLLKKRGIISNDS